MMVFIALTKSGQLSDIFLPLYHKKKESEGIRYAQRIFSVVVNWMMLVLSAFMLVAYLFSETFIELLVPGFTDESKQFTQELFYWILPLIILQVFNGLLRTMANAERIFGNPEMLKLFGSVLQVAVLLIAAPFIGIYAMIASLWAGALFNTVGLLIAAGKVGYRHTIILSEDNFNLSYIYKNMGYAFTYVGATQIYLMVFNAALSMLPQGMYAIFKYVQLIYSRSNSIFLRPVSIVYFTHVSETIAAGAEGIKALAAKALSKFMLIAAPAIVLAALFSSHFLLLILEGEKFPEEHVLIASQLLTVIYTLMLIDGLYYIGRKTALSYGSIKAQYFGGAAAQLLSAAYAYFVITAFGMLGVLSVLFFNKLALTSFSYLVLWIRHRQLFFYDVNVFLRWLLVGLVTYGFGFVANNYISGLVAIEGRLGIIIELLLAVPLVGLIFMASATLLRMDEIIRINNFLLGFFRKSN